MRQTPEQLLAPFKTPFDPQIESHTLSVYHGEIEEIVWEGYGPVWNLTLSSSSEDGTVECYEINDPDKSLLEAILAIWRQYPDLVGAMAHLKLVQLEGEQS